MSQERHSALILAIFSAVAASMAIAALAIARSKRRTSLPDTAPEVDTSVFDSPDMPGSGRCMDRELIRMLLALQRESGYPVLENISSGARSTAHNARVGGVANSSHLIPVCRAVDIRVPGTAVRDHLVRAAVRVGFVRIGIGRTFVHLDNDPSKSQKVAWGYPKGTPAPFNPYA